LILRARPFKAPSRSQGKYFEITLDGGLSRAEAETEVGRMAREVLTNPVIEEFRFSLEE
jgi:phosphoribosylformylglycinamidine (FGAM) synthase PurS component